VKVRIRGRKNETQYMYGNNLEKPHERPRSRTQCIITIYPRVIDYFPADFSVELPNSDTADYFYHFKFLIQKNY
jgi:hypothetical protein